MTRWTTTVIVSSSLQKNELSKLLLVQEHRVRFSDNVEPGSLVFPQSGTAFMLIAPEEFPEQVESTDFFDRIETFVQVHRNSFLLLHSPVYGAREWEIVCAVQNRFFGSNLKILPVHSNGDAVRGMLTIAKATSKPHVDSIRDRMCLARAHIVENNQVCDVLQNEQEP